MRKFLSFLVFLAVILNLSCSTSFNIAFAGSSDTGQVSSVFNSLNSQVTIQGKISSGEGKWVTVIVINPNGAIDYIDQTRSRTDGSFEFSYILENRVEGRYLVKVRDTHAGETYISEFAYESDNADNPPYDDEDYDADDEDDNIDDDTDDGTSASTPADIFKIIKDAAEFIDNPDNTVQQALAKVKGVIKIAGSAKDREMEKVQEELKSLIARLLSKAGYISQDELQSIVSDNTDKFQIEKELINSRITQLLTCIEQVSGILREAGFSSLANMEIRKELKLELAASENKETRIAIPAGSIKELYENGIYVSFGVGNVVMDIPPSVFFDPDNTSNEAHVELSFRELTDEKSAEYTGQLAANADSFSRFMLAGKIYDFNIELTDGNETKRIPELNEKIAVALPYNNESFNGEKLGVYCFNPETGKWDYIGGTVNNEDKRIIFYTDHFSLYTVFEYSRSFKDITNHWAKEDIEILASKHIVKGVDETNFAPERSITRAEFAALIVRALGTEIIQYRNVFSDVDESAWYKDYVQTAAEYGLVTGFGGKFRPDDTITREEMAVIAVRAYLSVKNERPEESDNILKFSDGNEISSWAVNEVAMAKGLGLVNGVDSSRFMPKGLVTRAQSATIIRRLLGIL